MIIIYAGNYNEAQVAGNVWYISDTSLAAHVRIRSFKPHGKRKHFVIHRTDLEEMLTEAKMSFVFRKGRYKGYFVPMQQLQRMVKAIPKLLSTKNQTFKIKGLS